MWILMAHGLKRVDATLAETIGLGRREEEGERLRGGKGEGEGDDRLGASLRARNTVWKG